MTGNADFDEGFLLGLAIAYKRAAAAAAMEGLLWLEARDGVTQAWYALQTADEVAAALPEDLRPGAADSTALPIVTVTDAVTTILT